MPGFAAGDIDGRLPQVPELARMRFRFWSEPEPVETDAYRFLGLLLAHEADLSDAWTNHLGQVLSTRLLMQNARDYYLSGAGTAHELDDHSNLHLVELLLDYDRRLGGDDANVIKRRFLAVELERGEFGSEWCEILGHYVDSLGALVADPRVRWEPAEIEKVRRWLEQLDDERFHDLGPLELQPLSHLLRGLRRIADHRDQLQAEAAPVSE